MDSLKRSRLNGLLFGDMLFSLNSHIRNMEVDVIISMVSISMLMPLKVSDVMMTAAATPAPRKGSYAANWWWCLSLVGGLLTWGSVFIFPKSRDGTGTAAL